MKMSKEEFRKKIKEMGYQIRFRRLSFEGRSEYYAPIIKKDGVEITGGNVYTKDFFNQHKAAIQLYRDNSLFPC